MTKLTDLLFKHWKAKDFRPMQKEICISILENNDTLALLPTGGGKSLCYQLPSLLFEGSTLVISPLISLMQDQVAQANAKGIKSMAFNATQSLDKQLDNAAFGQYKLLYCSPEKAQNALFLARLSQLNIQCIAVDEAHCISQWGNDFRPAFREIKNLREKLPKVPIIAVTASATPAVIKDIKEQLALNNPREFKTSFARKNIAISIENTQDKFGSLLRTFQNNNASSIIYCSSRRETEEVNQLLNSSGIKATYFHGGLSAQQKQDRLLAWQEENIQIIVATNAFGMGIDKGNVGLVVHLTIPASLEHYYQEIGRAGRNGERAKAIAYFSPGDEQRLIQQFLRQLPSPEFIQKCYKSLCNYLIIGHGEGIEQEWRLSFQDFCQAYQFNPKKVDACITLFDQASIFHRINTNRQNASCRIITSPAQFKLELEKAPPSHSKVLQIIGREYAGIFERETIIDLDLIVRKSNLSFSTLINVMEHYKQQKLLLFNYATSDLHLIGIKPRDDKYTLNQLLRNTAQIHTAKKEKLNSILTFVKQDDICKQIELLAYFGESITEKCSLCNAKECLPEGKEIPIEDIAVQILNYLERGPIATHQLKVSLPHLSVEELAEGLAWLERQQKIKTNALAQIMKL